MIFVLAAAVIAILITALLFNKYVATPPKSDAIKNLNIPSSERPKPNPMNTPIPKAPAVKNNEVDAARKAMNDLMNQYMGTDPYSQSYSSSRLTMADKMRLLEDYKSEMDVEPDLSEDELEQKIATLEEELMDIEDTYASVQADAEVTGDRTEIDKIDERYGDVEELLAKYREQLENYGKRNEESIELMNNIIKDIGLGDENQSIFDAIWADDDSNRGYF